MVGDSRDFVRETVAYILGQLGVEERSFELESIPILIQLCEDESAMVRGAAAAALGHNTFNEQMCSIVERKLCEMSKCDVDYEVRADAIFALSSGQSESVIKMLLELKNDDSEVVSEAALCSLEVLFVEEK